MQSKIKLLEVCHDLSMGGIERAMQEFAINIDKSKFDVIVAVYDDSGPRKKILEDAGIEVLKTTEKDLKKLISERKIDIVHVHTIHVKHAIGDTPCIQEVVFSGGYSDDAEINLFISKALALKTSTCKNLEYGKNFYILYYPQNVADWDSYKIKEEEIKKLRIKLGFTENDLIIGRLGRPEPSKTDFLLLASAPLLAKQNNKIKFLFVGLPLLYRVWLSFLPSMRGKIINLPATPDDEILSKFYQTIDVFWHTASRGETFGNVNAEAMIFQKPVITHSTPFRGKNINETLDNAQIEIVDHMKTGIIASYPSEVCEAVNYLSDPKVRLQMGLEGRKKVLKEYDAKVIVRQLEHLAISMLNRENAKMSPSKKEVEEFFNKDYNKRLTARIGKIKNSDITFYKLKKAAYKPLEFTYLVLRLGLRKINIDIEKWGFSKSLNLKE